MGLYINKGNRAFADYVCDEYVDKTELIAHINQTFNKERRFSCVTRCRRFGKSMAARMLCAYYDESCDSRPLFAGLKIAQQPEWDKYLNKFPVIYVDITDFTTRYRKDETIVEHIKKAIQKELLQVYTSINHDEEDDLMATCFKIVEQTQKRFVMIIDEWDAVLREYDQNSMVKDDYVDLLRRLFKGSASMDVFAGVYMTGILPIKKYQTESALNNFWEYSMVEPGNMAPFYGFTSNEVQALADKYGADAEELKKWYDGYKIGDERSIYNPYSVIQALHRKRCKSYWATTGAYDSVRTYIQLNFEGLKDDIINMLGGGRCDVRTSSFQNDMSIVRSKDDALTVLIHLGYLAYDDVDDVCYIPNKEVADEMEQEIIAV